MVDVVPKLGDKVAAGDILVKLEFPSLRAEVAARGAAARNAESVLQNARLIQERVHKLADQGAASRAEVDAADRDVNDAESAVAQIRSAQAATESAAERTMIRAPFNGVVSERLHNPGDSVGTADNDVILRVMSSVGRST